SIVGQAREPVRPRSHGMSSPSTSATRGSPADGGPPKELGEYHPARLEQIAHFPRAFLCFELGTLLWIIRTPLLPEHVPNPIAFHGKTGRITAFIIALVFLMPVLAISLPSVTLPGKRAMDVTSLKTPTYAESSRATLLNENNWTMWSLTAQQYGATLTYSSDGLTLMGSFPPSTQPLAL